MHNFSCSFFLFRYQAEGRPWSNVGLAGDAATGGGGFIKTPKNLRKSRQIKADKGREMGAGPRNLS
jgi:hypothetical protein